MFESLRYNLKHNRKSVIKNATAWFLFSAIIIVFALWGLSPSTHQGMGTGTAEGGAAALVNGHMISLAQLGEAEDRMRRDPRFEQLQSLGGDAGRQMIRQQAISQLVEMELARQATDHQRLWTTDTEVRDVIVAIPAFQEEGRFQKDRYMGYLQSVRKTPAEFEEEIRREQSLRRTVELFRSSLAPLDMEAQKQKELSSLKANVEFVSVPTESLVIAETVPQKDIAPFLQDAANEVKVKEYFTSHSNEFSTKETAKARHILVKFESGNAESEKKALVKIEEVAAKAKSEDFAKLAKQYSDDPGSAANGGDLGSFERGRMVPEFESVAFSAPLNEISKPVKTQFGYHLIQVQERAPAKTRTLEESREEIAEKLISQDRSREALKALEEALKNGDVAAISKFVETHKLKWEETGAFSIESGNVPKIGPNDDVVKAAFSVSATKPYASTLVRQGPTAFLVRYKAVPAVDKAKKDEQSPEMMQMFAANRRSEDALRMWLDGLKKSAKITTNAQTGAAAR